MKTFDNVAKLKLATLTTGQFVETGGYYTKGGGGAAKYLIVAPQAADGYGDHVLANGNVAVLQDDGKAVTPEVFGAAGDGITDDTAALNAAGQSKAVVLSGTYLYTSAVIFTKDVHSVGGNLVPNLSFNVSFQANDEIDAAWFGAVPDATISGEVVSGTDNYLAIQAALFSAASTNGKKTLILGGGDYRIDTGLRNWLTAVGTCSIIGKGLLGARLLTDKDITALHIGGSAQTIKRIYVLFANPSAELPNQIGVEFANDNFQWSQSVIEQVWVQNPQIGFLQRDYTSGAFGTIFLNAYRNCQIIANRGWGVRFDSKNGSTTIHLDTVYVKGSGTGAKGFYFRSIKDILMSNCAIDTCYNNLLDVAAVNLFNAKNLAIEGCFMTNGTQVGCNLNATTNHVDGFTSTVTNVDVGSGQNARILFFGGNAIEGNTVKGFIDLGTVLTSGNFVKSAIAAAATKVQILDDSVRLSETFDNGFAFGFGIKGQDFSRSGNSPDATTLTGDREKGHVFWNGNAAVGQPTYWVNTTGGASSTYVAGPNL